MGRPDRILAPVRARVPPERDRHRGAEPLNRVLRRWTFSSCTSSPPLLPSGSFACINASDSRNLSVSRIVSVRFILSRCQRAPSDLDLGEFGLRVRLPLPQGSDGL